MDVCQILPPEETDQDNLPDLVNGSRWFRKCLANAANDKLSSLANVVENATGLIYPNPQMVDTVIAKDSRLTRSFRYGLYPEYKLTRKIQRARRGQYQLGPVFDELYANVFPQVFPPNTVQLVVDGAEGDDVIASLAKSDRVAEDYDRIILVSSDRDFVQLQIDRPVQQYDAKGERVLPRLKRGQETIELTPQQALLIKEISGDHSDNIKPIKPKVGEVRAWKYITENRDEFRRMLKEERDVAERLLLNQQLIDFNYIPQRLRDAVVDEFYRLRTW